MLEWPSTDNQPPIDPSETRKNPAGIAGRIPAASSPPPHFPPEQLSSSSSSSPSSSSSTFPPSKVFIPIPSFLPSSHQSSEIAFAETANGLGANGERKNKSESRARLERSLGFKEVGFGGSDDDDGEEEGGGRRWRLYDEGGRKELDSYRRRYEDSLKNGGGTSGDGRMEKESVFDEYDDGFDEMDEREDTGSGKKIELKRKSKHHKSSRK